MNHSAFIYSHTEKQGFPGGAVVKNPPTSAEDTGDTGWMPWSGRSPGGGNATHSSILAWEIPRTEDSGSLQSRDHKELDMTEQACIERQVGHYQVLAILNKDVMAVLYMFMCRHTFSTFLNRY